MLDHRAAVDRRTALTGPAGPPRDPRDPWHRMAALFDAGTFWPGPEGDRGGVLAGTGSVDGLRVTAFASDPREAGGALGGAGCATIVAAYDAAVRARMPVVGLWHSGGARLREGVESLHGVGSVFAAMTRASGLIPQVSVVLGPARAGPPTARRSPTS
jgi:acetyl-CoA/propionyl-CoA carboxylase carboxyl transferase subunit